MSYLSRIQPIKMHRIVTSYVYSSYSEEIFLILHLNRFLYVINGSTFIICFIIYWNKDNNGSMLEQESKKH